LSLPPFITAPRGDQENDEDGSSHDVVAVPIPQLLELFPPDFLINFIENIGHLNPSGPFATGAILTLPTQARVT
jgi:hypothetical protein